LSWSQSKPQNLVPFSWSQSKPQELVSFHEVNQSHRSSCLSPEANQGHRSSCLCPEVKATKYRAFFMKSKPQKLASFSWSQSKPQKLVRLSWSQSKPQKLVPCHRSSCLCAEVNQSHKSSCLCPEVNQSHRCSGVFPTSIKAIEVWTSVASDPKSIKATKARASDLKTITFSISGRLLLNFSVCVDYNACSYKKKLEDLWTKTHPTINHYLHIFTWEYYKNSQNGNNTMKHKTSLVPGLLYAFTRGIVRINNDKDSNFASFVSLIAKYLFLQTSWRHYLPNGRSYTRSCFRSLVTSITLQNTTYR
jgi:hypothetical protein